jgi:23S rRNA (uracil1939-C5)-methyltransferase
MGRRNRKLPFLEKLVIEDAGSEGKAVARFNDRVVFIPFAVPGDVVDVQVIKKRKNYYEGKIVEFKEHSSLRVQPECQHFGVCGGCKWQVLNYKDQLSFKQKQVEDALSRIGKIDTTGLSPILANDKPYFYRNKLEFTFSNFKWLEDFQKGEDISQRNMNGLGFHKPGMFDRIVDIKKCHLMEEPANAIRLSVKEFADKNDFSFYDIKRQEGLLRNLIIRSSSKGDLMVILVFHKQIMEKIEAIMEHLNTTFPEITSLIYMINEKKNDSISDLDFFTYSGSDHIKESMTTPKGTELSFKVGPKSFYQTNSAQAEKLYRRAYEFAGFKGGEIVYDLYTGTGTIANYVAEGAKKVVGIEYVEEAIADARINAKLNQLENTVFYAGDMAKVFTPAFIEENGNPDVIIADPPRAGMHPDVIKTLLSIEAQKIVYVSCNPATQARDLSLLSEKYEVKQIQPVDMFPQTAHVENIVELNLIPINHEI